MIEYPTGKCSPAVAALAAVLVLFILSGCSLTYVQGADHQRLDVEILRPIDVNHDKDAA